MKALVLVLCCIAWSVIGAQNIAPDCYSYGAVRQGAVLAPSNTVAGSALYNDALRVGALKQRASAFEEFLIRFPQSPLVPYALRNLLLSYDLQGNAKQSIATAKRLLGVCSTDYPAMADLAYHYLIEELSNQLPITRDELLHEVERLAIAASPYVTSGRPDDLFAMNGKMNTDQPDQLLPGAGIIPGTMSALITYDHFTNIFASYAMFEAVRGRDLLEEKKYEGARNAFLSAVRSDPSNELATWWLAEAYLTPERISDRDESRGLWFAARAVTLAWSQSEKQQFSQLALNYYRTYHGSTQGWTELVHDTRASTFPPLDFTILASDVIKFRFDPNTPVFTLDSDLILSIRSSSNVILNGWPVKVEADIENKVRFLGNDPPHSGINWIRTQTQTVLAYAEGLTMHKISKTWPYKNSYAVVVAIDDYKVGRPFRPLYGMVWEADSLVHALTSLGFSRDHVITLYNSQAILPNITRVLQSFWEGGEHSDADRVFFYFGGHGTHIGKTGLLVTYDYDPSHPTSTGLLMSDLTERHSQHMVAHHILFALDACSSGLALPALGTDVGNDADLNKPRTLAIIRNDTDPPARNVLVAGTGDQPALFNEYRGGGIFTHALVDGLSGLADLNHDGIIQFEELALYVKNRVAADAADRAQKQEVGHYKLNAYGTGEILFIRGTGL